MSIHGSSRPKRRWQSSKRRCGSLEGSGKGKGQGQGQGQGRDGRDRDRPPPIASADETKMGDHVVLLRTYEAWARGGHRRRFCEEHGLNDRGMEFARDVRKQLLGVFRDRDRDRDMDRGNGDRDGGNGDGDGGRGGKRDRDGVEKNQTQTQRRGDVTDLRKAICVGFANKLARRLPRHNGFRTFGADASMIAEAHPSVARSLADDVTGLLPEWVVFHSLVSTTRPFIKGVCRIEPEWAAQVMPRLGDVDVGRLSGGALAEERTGANAEKAAAAAAEARAAAAEAAKAGAAVEARRREAEAAAAAKARARRFSESATQTNDERVHSRVNAEERRETVRGDVRGVVRPWGGKVASDGVGRKGGGRVVPPPPAASIKR